MRKGTRVWIYTRDVRRRTSTQGLVRWVNGLLEDLILGEAVGLGSLRGQSRFLFMGFYPLVSRCGMG